MNNIIDFDKRARDGDKLISSLKNLLATQHDKVLFIDATRAMVCLSAEMCAVEIKSGSSSRGDMEAMFFDALDLILERMSTEEYDHHDA